MAEAPQYRKLVELSERHAGLICLLVYIAGSARRMRAFLFEGRFWAEEGQVFFPALHEQSWREVASFLHNGHVELFTNITVWLSTVVPFRYAPLATTYVSLLFQLLPLWFLVKVRCHLGLSAPRCILLVLIAVTIPQGAEVWANSTNLHFHFALLAALTLVVNYDTLRSRLLTRVLLVCCGLSGIPANFLTPCFGLKALVTRSRTDGMHFLVLLCTSGLQLFLLSRNPTAVASRVLELNVRASTLAYISQVLVTPTLPERMAKCISLRFAALPSLHGSDWLVVALVFVVFGMLICEVIGRGTAISHKLLVVSLFLAACLVAAAMGAKGDRITFAGRYFYGPVVLFYAAILTIKPRRLVVGWLVLAMVVLQAPANVTFQFKGPAWSKALARARANGSDSVKIWPRRWVVPNPE